MSIQEKVYTSKKTGKTNIRYYAAVYNVGTGKLETGPLRNTKKLARQDETDIIRALEAGKPIQKRQDGNCFDIIAAIWMETSKPPAYSNTTYQGYKYYLEHYLNPVFGKRPINRITALHIQHFVDAMKETYQPETVNKCITVLLDIFNFAISPLKEITSNPADGIKRLKVPKKKRAVWDDNIIQYFMDLESVKKSHYYTMFCISLFIGCRPSEVCGLEECSLQHNPPELFFDSGYDRYGERSNMKTDGSHRSVPLPPKLYKTLKKYLLKKRQLQLQFQNYADNPFLFVSPNGNPIKPSQYSKAFQRIITAHNKRMEKIDEEQKGLPPGEMYLPKIPLYNCRHSFATNALRNKHDAALVSSVMGNSVKTLLTFYAQTDTVRQLELINENAENSL